MDTQHDKARLDEARNEWEILGAIIHRKEREREQLQADIAELTRQRGNLSQEGRELMRKLNGGSFYAYTVTTTGGN